MDDLTTAEREAFDAVLRALDGTPVAFQLRVAAALVQDAAYRGALSVPTEHLLRLVALSSEIDRLAAGGTGDPRTLPADTAG